MSDLQKSFVKSRLAKLPMEPPPMFDETGEDSSVAADGHREGPGDDSSSASSSSSTGTIKPSQSKNLFARGKGFVDFPLHIHIYIRLGLGKRLKPS